MAESSCYEEITSLSPYVFHTKVVMLLTGITCKSFEFHTSLLNIYWRLVLLWVCVSVQ